jgi:glycosyltransferase involved in cell wall biosynthesis
MPTVLSLLGINPHRIGSEESFIRELSLQLGRAGWDHVVCYSAEPPEAVRKFLELPNLRIEVLKTVESLSWASATGVWRLLHKYRPRILHLHFLGFLGPYPWMARLASVEKLFFTDQGSRPANYVAARAPLWKRFLTRMIDWPITKVICVSNYGYQVFSACDLLPRDRFTMIYNSVDVARVRCESSDGMTFRRKYGIPDNAPLVVQVSWIIPEKGIPSVLEAAKLVIERNNNVYFVFVGEGRYRDEYSLLASRLGIETNVKWTGTVQDPLTEGVYAAADVVCQASDWQEVFGYVIAEAMASRRPVVATQVGGIPELVRDGETGFLVPRRDPMSLAEKLLRLLDDATLRERMGAAGRAAAEASFAVKKNVSELIKLYGIL